MENVIVYGAGYWGKNYIRELGKHCLAAVDPDPDTQMNVSSQFGVNVYSPKAISAEVMTKCDGVIIATPPQTHVELALPWLKKGVPTLIEKPLSDNTAKAESLWPFREHVFVGYTYMFNNAVDRLKLQFNNEVGWSHAFARRTAPGPVRPWGTAAWDLAAHDISIAMYLTDDFPIGVEKTSTDNWALIKLEFLAIDFLIYVSWFAMDKTRTVELIHPDATRSVYFDDVTYSAKAEIKPLTKQVSAFLKGSDYPFEVSLERGLDINRVLEMVAS